tara:strand:+ start:106 stop:420 length:315 start_codon:yes stop_codon:yes gene_type:complete
VNQDRGLGSLTRHEGTGRDGKKHTGAESHEERCGHEKIVLGKNETHGLRDKRVHEEEDETMEKDGRPVGAGVLERNLHTVGLEQHTRAECEEKNSGNGYLLGGK